METKKIFCCGCTDYVKARLTDGKEIYPQRWDLHSLPFWKCDECGNSVGCHHKTTKPTQPLGCIPTPALKIARMEIHKIIDPLWKLGGKKRSDIYKKIAEEMGIEKYHTAQIRSVEEAQKVLEIVKKIGENYVERH